MPTVRSQNCNDSIDRKTNRWCMDDYSLGCIL